MNPERVFQILLIIGLLLGGYLYGDYWRKTPNSHSQPGPSSSLKSENTELAKKIDDLEDQVAQYKSMLATGPYPVPDDLIKWIEQDYGMKFKSRPEVRISSHSEFLATAKRNLNYVTTPEHLKKRSLAWEKIGLIKSGLTLHGQLVMVATAGSKGIFDLTQQKIYLSENFDHSSVPDRSVLVKLLGQALTFQNYPQSNWASWDHWKAWEAVHIGAASESQARFLRRNIVNKEGEWKDPEPDRETLLNELEHSIQASSNFPYTDGADYAREIYLKTRAHLINSFENPPTKTLQIINNTPGDHQRPQKENVTTNQNSLGSLGLRLWLEAHDLFPEAPEIAKSWLSDQWNLRSDENSSTFEWFLTLNSEEMTSKTKQLISNTVIPQLQKKNPLQKITLSQQENSIRMVITPKSS